MKAETLTVEQARELSVEQFDAMPTRAIPTDAWRAIRPHVKRSCGDCQHNVPTNVSWWCRNEEAIAARRTAIPGICKCPFWAPFTHAQSFMDSRRAPGEASAPKPTPRSMWGTLRTRVRDLLGLLDRNVDEVL